MRTDLTRWIVVALAVGVGLTTAIARGPAPPAMATGTASVAVGGYEQTVEAGSTFTVDVSVEGVSNLGGYEWQLLYDESILDFVAVANGAFLGSSGRLVSCLDPIVEPGSVRFACVTIGASPPGPSGAGTLSTLTLLAHGEGTTPLDLALVQLADPLGDDIPTSVEDGAVTVVADWDGDGCTAAQEAAMGFDDAKWYDFFDVPAPVFSDPKPNGARDRIVNAQDVVGVLKYLGTSNNGPSNGRVDYDSDKNGDTVKDGRDYDRSPGPLPNPPSDAGPPDGVVNVQDVLAVLKQVGLSCAGSP